jgi:hypothetical protein
VVLKVTGGSLLAFAYGAVTRYGWPFQYHSASKQIGNSLGPLQRPCRALTTPAPQRLQSLARNGFGLFPFRSPLLREFYLFLGVLRCFSSPRAPRVPMYSAHGTQAFPWVGFPIRRSPDQSLLTAPRGLSQSTTSFIGSWRQGIRRTPLVA